MQAIIPPISRYRKSFRGFSAGFSLIEMLITLAILSVTLIAVVNMQLQTTRNIGELAVKRLALNILHNSYEECQANTATTINTTAAQQLPDGNGSANCATRHITVSWHNRFSSTKNTLTITPETS